jgi:DNA polymerase sigma
MALFLLLSQDASIILLGVGFIDFFSNYSNTTLYSIIRLRVVDTNAFMAVLPTFFQAREKVLS